MRYQVSKSDLLILTSVYKLFLRGSYSEKIDRELILNDSGVSHQVFSSRIKNVHIKEQLLAQI